MFTKTAGKSLNFQHYIINTGAVSKVPIITAFKHLPIFGRYNLLYKITNFETAFHLSATMLTLKTHMDDKITIKTKA